MDQLKRFQGNLRSRLRKLNKNNYVDVYEQKDKAKCCLEEIQQQLQSYPRNAKLQQREKDCTSHYISILSSVMDMLKQQSKLEWIKYEDDCTKIFFARAKQRKRATYIYTIKDEDDR